MNSYKKALIAVSIMCSTTIMILFGVLYYYLNVFNTYSYNLENIYKKNLYDLVTNVNSIEIDISKIVATTSKDPQQKLLNSIYNTCNEIEYNLCNLPIPSSKIQNVTNIYNTLSGYSYSLIRTDSLLIDADLTQLEELHSSCLIVMYDLNNYLNEITYNYSILSDINFNNESKSSFKGGFNEDENNDSDVPTLIYDGPFSDSVTNQEIKGLGEIEVSQAQAMDIVKDKFLGYEYTTVEDYGETNGKFATFNFKVNAKNIVIYVQVTKTGSKIISVNSYAESGSFDYSEDLSKELAMNFALSIGYENMYPVWSQVDGNVIYVNLAPLVNGVVYYPDLVKVKVDSTRAQVVGLDGTNYCYNHTTRTLGNPTISTATAEEKVGSKLTIIDTNLAVIPNEFVGETYCFEFICTWKDYEYYIYVDVDTGEEVDILRVCKTKYGNLIV